MLKLDKKEFQDFSKKSLTDVKKLSETSEKLKEYYIDKCDLVFDMFNELNKRTYLKKLNKAKIKEINKNIDKIMKTLDSFNDIFVLVNDEIEARKRMKECKIRPESYVLIQGLAFSSLCEINRELFQEVIDCSLIKTKEGKIKNINGLGDLIYSLKDNLKIQNIGYFDDIDVKLRNSFFHFNFKIERKDDSTVKIIIYCQNKPEIHIAFDKGLETPIRSEDDNDQLDYILFTDLLFSRSNLDTSTLALLSMIQYMFKKFEVET